MKLGLVFGVALCTAFCFSSAWATPPVEEMSSLDLGPRPALRPPSPFAPEPAAEAPSYDYLAQYAMACAFIRDFQVDDPTSPDDGGMREGEHMLTVIETDNTSESIWIWTRYYELTGDNQYWDNVQRAWGYCMRHPAYSEEGPPAGPLAYYKVYNCAWAMAAESKYRSVYGDSTYRSYADSCARFVDYYHLDVFTASYPYSNLNGPVASWAAGNLHLYGLAVEDTAYTNGAVEIGADVKAWVDANPQRLYLCYWAMSGGATMWGLTHSYFEGHPDEEHDWLSLYGNHLWDFAPYGDFQYAWDNWYALGHYAVWEAMASRLHKNRHRSLCDSTIARDRDLDGGLPAHMYEPQDHDQTWITNYKGYTCLNPSIPAIDLVLAAETTAVARGGRIALSFGLANNTASTQSFDIWTELFMPDGSPYRGNPFIGPIAVNLPPLQVVSRTLKQRVPPGAPLGTYTYTAKVGNYPDDVNDQASIRITVSSAAR
jgi:hypothetical protein